MEVTLVVLPVGGGALSAADRQRVEDAIATVTCTEDARGRRPGIVVKGPAYVPIVVTARARVDAGADVDAVRARVTDAVREAFAARAGGGELISRRERSLATSPSTTVAGALAVDYRSDGDDPVESPGTDRARRRARGAAGRRGDRGARRGGPRTEEPRRHVRSAIGSRCAENPRGNGWLSVCGGAVRRGGLLHATPGRPVPHRVRDERRWTIGLVIRRSPNSFREREVLPGGLDGDGRCRPGVPLLRRLRADLLLVRPRARGKRLGGLLRQRRVRRSEHHMLRLCRRKHRPRVRRAGVRA